MNNWKAVGYIFLGFGSVFLVIALIAILAIIAVNPTPLDLSPLALVASSPWVILASLMYVVGFVGYFAGKENDFKERRKPARNNSIRVTPFWSFPVGVIAFAVSYLLMATPYLDNPQMPLDNLGSPIIYSIAIGLVVGLISAVLIYIVIDR